MRVLHHRRRLFARGAQWTVLLAILAGIVLLAPAAAHAAACQSSSPPDGSYTVQLCLTSPADGASVTGDTTVTASTTVTSGTDPGIRRMTFYLDGAYLLTDYQAPYSFTLPSAKFIDGQHTLAVEAWMRPTIGGFITPQSTITLNFQNGVISPPVNTNTFTVRTGTTPAAGAPFVVGAAGDGAGGEQSEADTTNMIASWMPNLFLYLGDVYEQGSPTEFYNWYGPQARAGSYYGRFNSITDPTVGNHEYNAGQAPGYFDYWDNVPHYYSYDVHGWHLISIDANSAFNQTAPGTAQYQWLQNDLNQADAGSATRVGKTAVGASTTTITADTKYANKVTLDAGRINTVSAYLDGNGGIHGGGSATVRALVYSDASGSPGALKQTSDPLTIAKNQRAGWLNFTFSQPAALSSGSYWLALQFGGTSSVARLFGDTSSGASRTNTDSYSDGPADPFGSATTGNSAWSLYATFLPDSAHPCILAYWHQPLFNIGQEGNSTYMSSIWSLLAQHGAALVVNGHDHTYQRYVPLDGNGNPSSNGITELVAGTGGHAMGSFVTTDSRLAASASGTFGAVKLELNPAGAAYQFVATQGGVRDSGSVQCNPALTDSQVPTVPSGLTANASYKTRIDLSWSESTDNVGVTGYDIYRDGSLLTTVGPQTTYSDRDVARGSTHTYQVRAKDAAGNSSDFSNTASATTPLTGVLFSDGFEGSTHFASWLNPAPLSAGFPQNNGLAAEQSPVFSGSWAAEATSTGLGAVAWRELPESQTELYAQVHFKVLSQSTSVNLLRFRNDQVGANALATLFVSGTNRIGVRDEVTGIATTSSSAAGLAAPGLWHTLQAHLKVNGTSGQVDVWLDGNPISELSLSGIDLGTDSIGRLELGDPNSISNPKSFDVAFDDFAYDLDPIVDAAPPTAPNALMANAKSGLEVDLSWSPATDDIGVTGYDVYRDGTLVGSVNGSTLTYSDRTVSTHTGYTYTVVARDAAGNSSPASNGAPVTTGYAFSDGFERGNLSRWTTVNGLVAQQSFVDSGQWAAEGTSSGTAGASAVALLDTTVPELYYRTRFNLLSHGANNVSLLRLRNGLVGANPIGSVFVSTTGKLGFRNDFGSTSVTSTTSVSSLVWNELQLHVLVNGASSQVDVWLNGTPVPGLTGLAADLGTNPVGRLELGDPSTGRSFDVAFDNVIADTALIGSDAIPDSQPPTAPGNLRSTAVTSSEVDLAWDAATDDVGVTGYNVYRNGSLLTSVGGSTLTFADTGVSASTDYAYTVTAVDAAGHESVPSDALNVSTPAPPDTDPPSKPAGLAASATGSEVDLSWNASSDNVGVTGYTIYRDGSQLATVGGSTLTYADTNVNAGTQYTYTVSAVDAAANESPQSDPVTASIAVFADGFESGDLSKWTTVSGLAVQTANVATGTWAAEAKSSKNTVDYAVKTLPGGPYTDLYYRLHVEILSGRSDTVDILRLRTAAGTNLMSVYYDPSRRLGYRNDTTNQTTVSTNALTVGVWYEVKVHLVIAGTSSQVEVWLNGTKIAALSRTDSFGTSPIGQVVAGESTSGHAYDYAVDDVVVDRNP